ncbi:hypothetical protein BG006_000070 [Podila minutissima]|uniref:Uncharacterized protein n=1 Tax=Podila minutissima TaxID=64525 RepID=A0A9P5SQF2_9FUNG|nr:hypothetical protein BG006_000070 [Podila minutissima]
MALAKKQPASTVAASFADPNASSKSTVTRTQTQSASAAFTKRKPVKPTAASVFANSDVKSSSASTTSTSDRSQYSTSSTGPSVNNVQRNPVPDASGMGLGMAKKPAKTFQESQDELFSKLEELAATKTRVNPLDKVPPSSLTTAQQKGMKRSTGFSITTPTRTTPGNKSVTFNQGQSKQITLGNSSPASLKPQRRSSTGFQQQGKDFGPRRKINSAQFKTPSTVEMAELAEIVVANASPPKVQNKLRKRYEAALRDAMTWEKKYSSAQHQIHYEREQWEEKYGELEKMLHNQESIKTETNVEKMNSLLDTVQQLQMANEVFRKQLKDAGIEPDPKPAVEYHWHHLLMGENDDRTVLEENELIQEKSIITNQKIAHLSSEINNVAIAISQTINYIQLRYLTQMLDAAEHVPTQKRTRAMSNSFLSDMLSRGVKKAGPLQAKNTTSIATQTPPSILTALQLQQAESSLRPLENKLNKSFSFTSSLLNLAGLNTQHNSSSTSELQYRLKGRALDDRSQLIHCRPGIPPVIVQDLKGSPRSPEPIDLLANSRVAPIPKFQYASPTTSQLRLFVPDGFGHMTSSVSNGSQGGSMHNGSSGEDGWLRQSAPDISSLMSSQSQGHGNGWLRAGGKYPLPHNLAPKHSSETSMTKTSLHRAMSEQFLSPEMAMHYRP